MYNCPLLYMVTIQYTQYIATAILCPVVTIHSYSYSLPCGDYTQLQLFSALWWLYTATAILRPVVRDERRVRGGLISWPSCEIADSMYHSFIYICTTAYILAWGHSMLAAIHSGKQQQCYTVHSTVFVYVFWRVFHENSRKVWFVFDLRLLFYLIKSKKWRETQNNLCFSFVQVKNQFSHFRGLKWNVPHF